MFGMSVFQSVLERLKAEEDEEGAAEDEQSAHANIRGLNGGFVGNLAASGIADSGAVQRAYFDTASDEMLAPAKPIPKPVMPEHLARIRPEQIAADLGLTDTETSQGLADKRRRFAADNHPDLHHPEFRTNATTRMKIANMLIDEAQRRVRLLQRR
ncbi:hypothetical protein [Pararhizobium sp.]|uniref:hypothetical protein n=1 Tax=Pararhizobium sp. TaxID=1977563 RepID=UPI003D14B88E